MLIEVLGHARVQESHAVKKMIDFLVPCLEPSMQSVMLALLTPRPGYDGALSHEISDSTEHLYLSKRQVSGWSAVQLTEYQIPFFALSNDHAGMNLENMSLATTADFLRLEPQATYRRLYHSHESL